MINTDENLHGALVKALIESGYEVKPVALGNYGATDEVVISMAYERNLLFRTLPRQNTHFLLHHRLGQPNKVL